MATTTSSGPHRPARTRVLRVLHLIGAGAAGAAIVLVGSATAASAAPAAAVPTTLTQPDGAQLRARAFGDEWSNGFETLDGHTVLQDETGTWTYAVTDADGDVVPSDQRPDRDAPPAAATPGLREETTTAPSAAAAPSPSAATGSPRNSGTQPTLVILVAFADQPPVVSTPADWHSLAFGPAFSVSDYYKEVSYGQLSIVPGAESSGTVDDGVVGWLTLGSDHPNTGGNTGVLNILLSAEAIQAADPYVDYAAYDTKAPFGTVTSDELHIVVVAAGYEAAYSMSCGSSVWAHWLPTPAAVDGVVVGATGVEQVGEADCRSGATTTMAAMGTVAHELGHDLGWPDLYDTDGSSSGGVGYWSLMSSGSWLSPPAHPDAFSKAYQGWLTPQELQGNVPGVGVTQTETTPTAIQLGANPHGIDWDLDLANPLGGIAGVGEYFLVENRQKTGYDAGLPGCGLLVWHIDESLNATNAANAADLRRLVDLEEADGNDYPYQDRDPFPGTTGATLFSDTSWPNSKLYSGAPSGVSLQVLSTSCAPTMSMDVSAPVVDTGDALTIDVTGGLAYHNSGPAQVSAPRDLFGVVAARATATIPSAVPGGGDATVTVDLRRFFVLPLATGSVTITDPGAGVTRKLPVLLTPIRRNGVEVRIDTGWFDLSRWPWSSGNLRLTLTDAE